VILTLVILFFILFCIQTIFEKRKRGKVGKTSLPDRAENTQAINDKIKRIPPRVLVNEGFDVKIAKATKAFRELNFKYDEGIINELEFNSELSKIIFSIQIDGTAKNFTYTLHGMAS
jgi:hypothetical protein